MRSLETIISQRAFECFALLQVLGQLIVLVVVSLDRKISFNYLIENAHFRNKECLSGKCQEYPGSRKLCAGDRVEAVTALDIRYNDFHRSVYSMMKTADGERSCGANYTCPDGVHICETRYCCLD